MNVEEFIIELGFVDKKAVKGLNDYLKKVDQVSAKIRKSLQAENELLQEQLKLRQELGGTGSPKPTPTKPIQDPRTQAEKDFAKFQDAVAAERLKDTRRQINEEEKAEAKREKQHQEELKRIEKEKEARKKLSAEVEKSRRGGVLSSLTTKNEEQEKLSAYYRDLETKSLKEQKDLLKFQEAVNEEILKDTRRQVNEEKKLTAELQKQKEKILGSRDYAFLQRHDSGKAKELLGRINNAKTTRDMKALGVATQNTTRALRDQMKATNALSFAQKGLSDSTRHMIRGYVSLFAVFEGTAAISRVGKEFEGMRAAMLASSGSSEQAGKDLRFVRDEAVRLGLDLKDSTDAFIKLQFAAKESMEKSEIEALFTGFSEFATALQVDKFRQQKGLMALQQMLNKTTIMSEELKQQLAEQVPGSIQVFSRALGVSSKELFAMMERGELIASEVLPKVAKEFSKTARDGGALAAALRTVRVQQQTFTTVAQEGADKVFKSGFGEGLAGLFATLTEEVENSTSGLEGLGKTYKILFKFLGAAGKVLIPTLNATATVLGAIADVLSFMFKNELHTFVSGVGILTLAWAKFGLTLKTVNTLLGSIYFKLLAVIFLVEEVLAIFDPNKVGAFETGMFGGNIVGFEGFKLPTYDPDRLIQKSTLNPFNYFDFKIQVDGVDAAVTKTAGDTANSMVASASVAGV